MIVMTFTIELDTGLSYLLQSALPLANARSRDNTHRRGGPSDRTAIADAVLRSRKRKVLRGRGLHASGPACVRVVLVRRCGSPRAVTARCTSLELGTFPGVENVALAPS